MGSSAGPCDLERLDLLEPTAIRSLSCLQHPPPLYSSIHLLALQLPWLPPSTSSSRAITSRPSPSPHAQMARTPTIPSRTSDLRSRTTSSSTPRPSAASRARTTGGGRCVLFCSFSRSRLLLSSIVLVPLTGRAFFASTRTGPPALWPGAHHSPRSPEPSFLKGVPGRVPNSSPFPALLSVALGSPFGNACTDRPTLTISPLLHSFALPVFLLLRNASATSSHDTLAHTHRCCSLTDGQGDALLAPGLRDCPSGRLRDGRHPVVSRGRTERFVQLRRPMGLQAPRSGSSLLSLEAGAGGRILLQRRT